MRFLVLASSKIDLARFLQAREKRLREAFAPRKKCAACLSPIAFCYCHTIEPFAPAPIFVILIHRGESRRSIATGRMAHLSLSNSRLFEGLNYTHDERVNALIENPRFEPFLLYPGPKSRNLSQVPVEERAAFFKKDRTPVIFVVDGTWSHAKRMVRMSENIKRLPRVSFTPRVPSRFHVRRQPKPNCYSTIESIHEVIDLLNPTSRIHDRLLDTFDTMVSQQLKYLKNPSGPRTGRRRVGSSLR